MMTLSQRILVNLETQETGFDTRLERTYCWIWLLILHRCSPDALNLELEKIEAAVETSTPQFQLELAWKASVVENLIRQIEISR